MDGLDGSTVGKALRPIRRHVPGGTVGLLLFLAVAQASANPEATAHRKGVGIACPAREKVVTPRPGIHPFCAPVAGRCGFRRQPSPHPDLKGSARCVALPLGESARGQHAR